MHWRRPYGSAARCSRWRATILSTSTSSTSCRFSGWGCSRTSRTGLLLLFTALTLLLWRLRQPWLFAVIPATAALSFFALLQLLRSARRLPRWLCRVGSVSYSMYVFHFVLAWTVVPWLLQELQATIGPQMQLLLSLPLVVAGTFAVAVFSERFIEARGIALGQRLIHRLQAGAAPRETAPDAR